MNRYPDMGVSALHEALADRFGVPSTDLAAGAGSVAVLYHLLQATCADGDEVVYAWRSFEAYPIAVARRPARRRAGAGDADARHDLDAMPAAITDRTRVVLVCTPNNPTGPSVHRDELAAFLDRVPGAVLVAVDEAYREFVTDPDDPGRARARRGRDNVVVLRTFSKAYGLAGLRVGYAVAPGAGRRRRSASSRCPSASPRSPRRPPWRRSTARRHCWSGSPPSWPSGPGDGGLAEQGWDDPGRPGQLRLARPGRDTVAFAAACEAAGIIVRPFAGDGARVTIGEVEANGILLEVAAKWRSSRA